MNEKLNGWKLFTKFSGKGMYNIDFKKDTEKSPSVFLKRFFTSSNPRSDDNLSNNVIKDSFNINNLLYKMKYDTTGNECNFSQSDELMSIETQSVKGSIKGNNLVKLNDSHNKNINRARSVSLLKNSNIKKIESKRKVDMIQLLKSEIIKEKLNEEIENDIQIKKNVNIQNNKLNSRKIITYINNRDKENKI